MSVRLTQSSEEMRRSALGSQSLRLHTRKAAWLWQLEALEVKWLAAGERRRQQQQTSGSSLASISERCDPDVGSSVATMAQAASKSFLRFSPAMIKCRHRSTQKQIVAASNLRTLSSSICRTQGLEI